MISDADIAECIRELREGYRNAPACWGFVMQRAADILDDVRKTKRTVHCCKPELTDRQRLMIATLNPTVLGYELVQTIQRVTGVPPHAPSK